MARDRMIRLSLWEDPSFNKISLEARLTFIGMFSNADDYGYIRADSGSLKRLIFGYDEITKIKVEKMVEEVKMNFPNLHFYEINGEKYAHFVNWEKHQTQEKRWRKHTFPTDCSVSHVQHGSNTGDLADNEMKGNERKEKERKKKKVIHSPHPEIPNANRSRDFENQNQMPTSSFNGLNPVLEKAASTFTPAQLAHYEAKRKEFLTAKQKLKAEKGIAPVFLPYATSPP